MATSERNFSRDLEEVRSAVVSTLAGLNFAVTEASDSTIVAKTAPSLLSWGEDVVVTFAKLSDRVRVTVSCSPSSQLFDWGKSTANVEQVMACLSRFLS